MSVDILGEMYERRVESALKWLKVSIDVNKGNGSSAYYINCRLPLGWTKAYPETTGYLIETLYDYALSFPEMNLSDYAAKQADWLVNIQLSSGAYMGGKVGSASKPSIFNTGQIIFGLIRAYLETQSTKYLISAENSCSWLLRNLEKDNSWLIGSYIEGYCPSYYTRVIWAILYANTVIKSKELEVAMRKALQYYFGKVNDVYGVQDWSFKKDEKAFTHTIAYTIRGFYESSVLLEDDDLKVLVINMADKIVRLREVKGSLAGRYDERWNGDYSFLCLTGNCQLSIILSKLFLETQDVRYFNASLKLFEDILPYQKMRGSNNIRGSIAGSSPVYGSYMFMRYPNWPAKFFLDAYLLLKTSKEKLMPQKV
ncbi:MAG: hypothetical protein WD491_01195 [Balneolales bacterium]